MMNWGTHHLDIAMWAMNLGHTCPVKVAGTAELPSIVGGYEVPADFTARLDFATGETIEIRTTGDRLLIPRGFSSREREALSGLIGITLKGRPLLSSAPNRCRPMPSASIRSPAVKTRPTVQHLSHFYDVVRGVSPPVSDAESAHATNVALHLANISIRVGRPIRWDPTSEQIVDDPQASALLSAPRRTGYDL